MDPDPRSSTPRKVRFPPKPRAPQAPRPAANQIATGAQDNPDDGGAREGLGRRLQGFLSGHQAKKLKNQSTATAEVTFDPGASSTGLKTFGRPNEKTYNGSGEADEGETENLVISAPIDGVDDDSKGSSDDEAYREPWNYNTNYPITLPLRKPNSGDPEVLDREEFEEAAQYDESSINSASELGLPANSQGRDDENRMFLFQFPPALPFLRDSTSSGKEHADAKGKERDGGEVHSGKHCSLKELPKGYMGKMLVYKNGDIKMKLGDILYDVTPGAVCNFDQTVVAINTEERHCVALGKLDGRAVVTPNIDSRLDKKPNQ